MKLFIGELGTAAMVEFVESTEDRWKVISVLAPIEVRSAIRRKEGANEITSADALDAYEVLVQESRRLIQQTITQPVLDAAAVLVNTHNLRALEALQLGSALIVRDSLFSGDLLRFIASDLKLLAAATAEGFTVWNPAEPA